MLATQTTFYNSFPYEPNFEYYPKRIQYFKYDLTIECLQRWQIVENDFSFICYLVNKKLLIIKAKGKLSPRIALLFGDIIMSIISNPKVDNLVSVTDLSQINKIGLGSPSVLYSLITSNLSKTREFEYIIPSKAIKPILSIHRALNTDFRKRTQLYRTFDEALNNGLMHLLKIKPKVSFKETSETNLTSAQLQLLRIKQLSAIINEISWNQNYKPTICDIPDNDPFKSLFSAFYDLQKEIGIIVKDVAKHNENLEKQVKERTEKLINQIRKTQTLNVLLDRFIYSASHELRAPISSMLGLLKLIDIEADDGKKDICIELLKETVYKQDNILKQIIKIRENNKAIIQKNKIDFKQLLEEVIGNLGLAKERENLDFEIDIKQTKLFYTDKTRLKIIVSNLLKNALKYNLNNKIQLIIDSTSENSLIVIQDNGIGIHPAALPHIFDIFYKASEKNSGVGIGLFMVKEMVKSLDGEINVESKLSKGSIFTVKLPCLKNHSFPTN